MGLDAGTYSGDADRLAARRGAIRALVLLAGGALILGACDSRGGSSTARKPGPLRIAVTIPPLAGIMRAMAPADAEFTVLMAPGRSEHGYEFSPGDLARLGRADLVIYVGLGLEPKVEEFTREHASSERVDVCVAGVLGIPGEAIGLKMVGEPGQRHDYEGAHAESGHDHDHESPATDHGEEGHDDGHDHGAIDPHVWLDPVLMLDALPALAQAVTDAAARAGVNAGDVGARRDALAERLRGLDAAWREGLAPFAGAAIVTHHNAWSRPAARYGLVVAAVIRGVEGAEPSPGAIAASVDAIKEQHVKTVFVEPQFNPDAARRIAQAAGVRVGTLDPLGNGDYFAMMEHNLKELIDGLKGS